MSRVGKKTVMAALCVATFAPAIAEAGTALDLYYERSLMAAANHRCGLFSSDIGAALDASAAQARGAALRGGRDMATVKDVGGRAYNKAYSVACDSSDLQTAAQRVRQAFEGWSHVTRMTFPGEAAPWVADRTAYRSARWRLMQASHAGADTVRFGVAGQQDNQALVTVAVFADGAQPYAARLIYRDQSRAPGPWLGAPQARPLPPRSASRVVLAQDKSSADVSLSPTGREGAVIFRFPATAGEAIGALDPRERFAVEFVFPGDRVRTASFEVGDFAAGRAFLRLGSR